MLQDRLELGFAHEEAALLVTPIGEQLLKLGIELSVRHGPVGQAGPRSGSAWSHHRGVNPRCCTDPCIARNDPLPVPSEGSRCVAVTELDWRTGEAEHRSVRHRGAHEHSQIAILGPVCLIDKHDDVGPVRHFGFDVIELVHQREDHPPIILSKEVAQLTLVLGDSDVLGVGAVQLSSHLLLELHAVDHDDQRGLLELTDGSTASERRRSWSRTCRCPGCARRCLDVRCSADRCQALDPRSCWPPGTGGTARPS